MYNYFNYNDNNNCHEKINDNYIKNDSNQKNKSIHCIRCYEWNKI